MSPSDDTIVIASISDLSGVNELICQPSMLSMGLLYQALFLPLAEDLADYQEGPLTFVPRAAVAWEFSGDRRQLTFRLRDDLEWSDGAPLTSEDVRFSWEAQTHPAIDWKSSGYKRRIREVEVIDPRTVVFHFSEIYATQLHDAVQGVILPKHVWSHLPFEDWGKNPQWFADHLVVSGPFELESWQRSQRIALHRNERYFEAPDIPKSQRIIIEICDDPREALDRVRSGHAQIAEFVVPEEIKSLRLDPDLSLVRLLPHHFSFIVWNTRHPFLGDERVRRALTLAIDRQAIVDRFFGDLARVTETPIAPGVWAHHAELAPSTHDPGMAEQLLAEAGWTRSDLDGRLTQRNLPFRFELLTNSEDPLRSAIGAMVQDQLEQIGIDVQLETTDFLTKLSRLGTHEFDAVLSNVSLSTDLDLSHNFHTRAIEEGYNWGSFSDPRMDALLDEIASELEPENNRERLREVQELIQNLQPMTLLYHAQRAATAHQSIRGVDSQVVNLFASLRQWHRVQPEKVESV